MEVTGEEQRIYEYMEHLPPHRSAEWNRLNRRWYLEYARQYGAVCGIQQGVPPVPGRIGCQRNRLVSLGLRERRQEEEYG